MNYIEQCMFIHEREICLLFVDNCLFFECKEQNILDVVQDINKLVLLLKMGDSANDFLWASMNNDIVSKSDEKVEIVDLQHIGIEEKIILALGLYTYKKNMTPWRSTAHWVRILIVIHQV